MTGLELGGEGRFARRSRTVLYAAALSMVAALIHLWVTPEHFEEWWGYGAFFLGVAVFQGAYGLVLLRWPRPSLFSLGIAANLGVVVLWLVTRTSGIPFFGPHAGEVEAIGVLDLAVTAAELALVFVLAGLRFSRRPGTLLPTDGARSATRGGERTLVPILAFATVLLAGLALWLYLSGRPPGDGSPEAGFARDMMIHHAQAVEMAGIVQGRTENEEVRILATDIILTQQAQIGQMQGWLSVWDLSPTGSEPPMAWMGMPTEGPMPGMATQEEINALRDIPPEEMDRQFLQLMIPHHRAAVPMAEAVLDRTDRPEVERLASSIVASQSAEIKAMQDMLRLMGEKPPPAKEGMDIPMG